MDDIPTHRRSIVVECFEDDEGFDLRGSLRDERPWAGEGEVRDVHEMHLDLRVDRATLTITDARAEMARFPHDECSSIEPAFRALVGLSVTRGFNRQVQERLGRQRGCSHVEFLARAMGPVAIQSVASSASRRGSTVVTGPDALGPDSWLRNTCHLWAEEGIGAQKIADGWRPGDGEYPAPSVVELRRRKEAHQNLG